MNKTQRVLLNLSYDELHKLSVLANSKGVTIGEELRFAVKYHLESNKEKIGPALVKADDKLNDFIRNATEPRLAEVREIKK